jgi:GNAT superfamily N-acetyltransferase
MGMRDRPRGYRIPKALNVRPGGDRDVNLVKDLDLKCYHYPWSPEEWAATVGEGGAKWCLATIRDRPVGFAIWRQAKDKALLQRIGVRPDSRKQGIGTEILRHVLRCVRTGDASELSLMVPEIHCFPGHPDDVSAWLLTRGFRAESPIVHEYAYMYGHWVDGFCFVKQLGRSRNESTT